MPTKPSQTVELLKRYIVNRENVLLVGDPGVGKSELIRQACEAVGYDLEISIPGLEDPTEPGGFPWIAEDRSHAVKVLFGQAYKVVNSTKPVCWHWEDFGHGAAATQCFPAGTPIATPTGHVSIEDLHVNDRVIDGNGIAATVTHCFKQQAEGLMTIRAVGLLPIDATGNHPFLVKKNLGRKKNRFEKRAFNEAQWTKTEDIKPGDWMAVPIPKPCYRDKMIHFNRTGQILRFAELTPEFAKILGYYAGDGWYTQHKACQSVGFVMDDKYPELHHELIGLLSAVFATKVFTQKTKYNCTRFQIHDPALGTWLSKTVGDRSNNKHIPDFILYHHNRELLTAFLQGYFATDGSRLRSGDDFNRGVQWSTVSRAMAYQLQLALTRYGTLAPIKFHCRAGMMTSFRDKTKQYKVQDAYVIQCSDPRFLDELKVNYTAKAVKSFSFESDGFIWTRVKSVTHKEFSGLVYNIEVNGPATYTAHNATCHNSSYMQWSQARSVNGHTLPNHVSITAATNRRGAGMGVQGVLEPVLGRFHIIEVEPDLDDWCDWFIANKEQQYPKAIKVLAFLKFRPELLNQPKSKVGDMIAWPSPRSNFALCRLVQMDLPKELRFHAYSGCTGQGHATEYLAFERMWEQMPPLDAIIADPEQFEISENPSVLYAVAVGLASKANPNNFGRIARYGERLMSAQKGEFGVLLLKSCLQRDPKICNTAAYLKLSSGPLGKLFRGQE